jgi:hypothetical protein
MASIFPSLASLNYVAIFHNYLHMVFILQLIRHARDYFVYDQFWKSRQASDKQVVTEVSTFSFT